MSFDPDHFDRLVEEAVQRNAAKPNGAARAVRRGNGGRDINERFDQDIAERPRFRLARFNEIKCDTGAPYLIKGLLPSAGLAVIWGEPKCGKSFWTFDALMHVALDWEYRGHRVKPGAVVYYALEGAQGFKNRIEAFRQRKLAESVETSPPFYLMSTPLSLVADARALVADIHRQLGDQRPVAVVIDTLNRSLAGSESSDEDMAAYIRAADTIRAAFDCLVIIVHHCGHNGERPRGHSSLMGALDVQISVKRDAAENVVAELELAKDGEVGLKFDSRLEVVEIGPDQDGDPITSCVVKEVEAGAAAPTKPKSAPKIPASERLLINTIGLAIAEAGIRVQPSSDSPVVSASPEEAVRSRYYARIAEQAEPGKDVGRLGAGPNRRADRPMPLGGA